MSLRRLSSVATLSLGFLAVAAAASATPAITITAPALGTTVRNFPKPTITIAYSSSDPSAPLDLASLTITVNGVDRTSLFTNGPDSASWTLGPDDELPAGTVVLYASIRDTATPPGQADTSQSNEVLPSLRDVQLRQGDPGDTLTVTAFGLDPAGTNVLLFGSLFSGTPIEAPFVTVDPVAHTGTVAIPQDAATGNVSLKVNGRTSPESVYFVVKAPFHMCGSPLKMLGLADGSLLVLYEYYYNFGGLQDPACPVSPGDANVQHARVVLSYGPTGTAAVAAYTDTSNYFDVVSIFDIAVDKAGLSAVLKQGGCCTPATILYNGTPTTLPSLGFSHVYGPGYGVRSDFDSQGNLYLALTQPVYVPASNSFVYALDLYKVSREALVAGGEAVPQLVGRIEPERQGLALVDFRVSCDGFGYLAASGGTATAPLQFLRKVDLASGGGVWTVDAPPYPVGLTLTCNTGEVFGASYDFASTVQVWRNRDGAPVELLEQLVAGPLYTPLAVAPGGAIYAPNLNGIGPLRTRVDPKIVNGTLTAQAYPCQQEGLNILASTTRWKPQRSDDPITVDFAGPDNLVLTSGELEITGPAGPITVSAPITVTSPTGPFTYRMQWMGPRTYTDPTGQVRRLPAAYYPFVVRATTATGSVQSLPFNAQNNPYARVALAEVSKVEFKECSQVPGVSCGEVGARLANNVRSDGTPMPGGGKAAFPGAVQQGGAYQTALLVRAELTPDLGADASLVTVHFRAIDVDDPSASAAGSPIDDDSVATTSTDNRIETATLTPSVTAGQEGGVSRAIGFFRVSTQQGNNYRIAASTHEFWLTDLCGVVSSTVGAIQHAPCYPAGQGSQLSADPSNNEVAQVSDMLTVWRTLHLELDRVDPATAGVTQQMLDQHRDWTNLGARRLTNQATGVFDPDHDVNDDWLGAELSLDFHPADSYPVTGNRSSRVDVRVPNGSPNLLNGQQAQNITVRGYTLRDDEMQRFLDVAHDTSMLAGLLEQVYVRVESHYGDAINPNTSLPWTRIMTSGVALTNPRDTTSSKPFWAVPLVLAFEGTTSNPDLSRRENERRDTADPSNYSIRVNGRTSYFGGLLGFTIPGASGDLAQPRSLSFIETIRDFKETNTTPAKATVSLPEIYSSNAAHETLHSLTLAHRGGIMCASRKNDASDPMRFSLTPTQLSELRDIEQPKWPTQPDAVCGRDGAVPPDCCPTQ